MRFHYAGKYSGKADDLPSGELTEKSVIFREPEQKTFEKYLAIASLAVTGIFMGLACLRAGGVKWFSVWGCLLSILVTIPHEFLHAICFKEDVYMYQHIAGGMLFVIGPERMSRSRFVFMCLLPNIVFGFIPFLLFMIWPEMGALGTLGAFAIGAGVGDYLNAYNAMTQVPSDGKVFSHGFNSFWEA